MTRLTPLGTTLVLALGIAPALSLARADSYNQMETRYGGRPIDPNLNPNVPLISGGAGDAWRGRGDYLIKVQQAALLHEEVRRARLDTRRMEWQAWEAHQDFMAGLLTRQQLRDKREELRRAVQVATISEIASGSTLNVLLRALEPHKSKLATLRSEPFRSDTIEAVNTNVGKGGNLGMIKGGIVTYPTTLQHQEFSTEREQINSLVAKLYRDLIDKRSADPQCIQELNRLGTNVREKQRRMRLNGRVIFSQFHDFSAVNNFVNQLDDALSLAYREPADAALFLRPVEARSAAELAYFMIDNGLKFAPPTYGKSGDRQYQLIYREMLNVLKQVDPDAGAVSSPR